MGVRHFKFQDRVIEGITLDFWNSIADDREYVSRLEERSKAAQGWLADHGNEFSLDEIKTLFQSFAYDWLHQWKENFRTPGTLDCVAHILNGLNLYLIPAEVEELAALIEEVILEMPPKLVDGAVEAIKKLHEYLPLAIVCDTGISGPRVIDELMKGWGILQYLDVRVYSLDVGISKPSGVIFKIALDRMGIQPNRALHLGDLEETDIKGAKNIGMAAVRFDGGKNEKERSKSSRADMIVDTWEEFCNALTVADTP